MEKNIKNKDAKSDTSLSNHGLVGFMKHLRRYLTKQYKEDFYFGSIYFGDNTITFFSFTPKELKKQKLKIVIVYNHPKLRFEIWLAGQNKKVQKEYWEMFKDSDWDKHHIPISVTDVFSIVESDLVEEPNFNNFDQVAEIVEPKARRFVNEIGDK